MPPASSWKRTRSSSSSPAVPRVERNKEMRSRRRAVRVVQATAPLLQTQSTTPKLWIISESRQDKMALNSCAYLVFSIPMNLTWKTHSNVLQPKHQPSAAGSAASTCSVRCCWLRSAAASWLLTSRPSRTQIQKAPPLSTTEVLAAWDISKAVQGDRWISPFIAHGEEEQKGPLCNSKQAAVR